MEKTLSKSRLPETKSGLKLTPAQEAFARAYTAYGEETFCNGYLSLVRTREFQGSKESAYSCASQLKSHPVVQARMKELMEGKGLIDTDVDLEHLKVIKQDRDLSNKMKGIIEYNRLKGRIKEVRQPVTVNILDFSEILKQQKAYGD